jgi:hypothetical protein
MSVFHEQMCLGLWKSLLAMKGRCAEVLRVYVSAAWIPGSYWVEMRMKPCSDGLKMESGMDMVFNVPSPVTLE